MKELNEKQIDKSVVVAEVNKQSKFLGQITLQPGQKLYRANIATQVIEEITPDKTMVKFDTQAVAHSLNVRENCLYICAINLENAKRKFRKLMNILITG